MAREGVDALFASEGFLEVQEVVEIGGVVAGLDGDSLLAGGAIVAEEAAGELGLDVIWEVGGVVTGGEVRVLIWGGAGGFGESGEFDVFGGELVAVSFDEVEYPGFPGVEIGGFDRVSGDEIQEFDFLRLDADEKGLVFVGEALNFGEKFFELGLGFDDWAVREIEVLPYWGGFEDGEVVGFAVILVEASFTEVALEVSPEMGLSNRSFHRTIIAQMPGCR